MSKYAQCSFPHTISEYCVDKRLKQGYDKIQSIKLCSDNYFLYSISESCVNSIFKYS